MLKSIEKNFFIIVQRLGLFFALIAFVLVVVMSFISYDKINASISNKSNVPAIEFAKYQNPISAQTKDEIQALNTKEEDKFNQEFNTHIEKIVANLERLPEDVIDKTDLKQNVSILVKIKSNPYTKELQLAYAKSLARLIKQMVDVGGSQVNVDNFIKWHDQEFAKQVDVNKQLNIQQYFLFKLASITIDEAIGFAILGAAALMLGIFIIFVMMLAMLRIEKNTRK
ncbi:hypothetical protein [Candidatus Thioglobus sp.]|jgi:predicted negative regulator of RcsB-dependent stress response|uniref:hypothetical protein n=1 Tax=Candidatus Thioglobus sp. TaxID=2026721 RepID=UPI00175C09BA|nr:hypothetical protein [Candidatus Thioglobus sp.]